MAAVVLLTSVVLWAGRPVAADTPANALSLTPLGTYDSGVVDESAAEIVTHDPATQRLFVVNAHAPGIDVLDITEPTAPTLLFTIDVSAYGAGVNSVDFHEGVLAAAVQADPAQLPGAAVFFDADGNYLNHVPVGALPDMLTFTPDGRKVLVANEGEPDADYLVDPDGSVSVIDLSQGVANASVSTATFTAFNGREAELRARGIRIFGPGASASQDLEPEYIAVSADSSTAFVALQENNAFAVIDVANATVRDILPLGVKNHRFGMPELTTYTFSHLPVLGITATRNPANPSQRTPGQKIHLGGFSGLWFEGEDADGNYHFATVPDRGPNGEPTDVNGDGVAERPFALPNYQARVIRFMLNPHNGRLQITQTILLTRPDGSPITGRPNIPGTDETPVDLWGNLLPYDALGADLEGIIVNPADGHFWAVDEYRPAIYHFDANGVLVARYVPEGTAALAGEPVGTFGEETLPAEYSTRRPNRGFEAMAWDTDTGILYAFIQTPLANPNTAASNNSSVIRMLGIDPATGESVAEYVYLLEKVAYRDQVVDKMGDAVYAGNGTFYTLERDSSTNAFAKKYIFQIDLKGATNLLAPGAPALLPGLTLEQHTPDQLAALGIVPVYKTKVTNLPSIGYVAGDKAEGLALLPDGRLAVLNDNDFGVLAQPIPVDGTVPLSPDPVPVVLGIVSFPAGNTLDPSDRDGGIHLANWPVYGMFQPDGLTAFAIGEQTFYLTANEGDVREYDGFNEAERVRDLPLDEDVLLGTGFPDLAALQADANLGRLTVTAVDGDLDGDGLYDKLYVYGARSFTIWDQYGNLVFDSGDDFETITAALVPTIFNSNGTPATFDTRSDNKGPEPEGVDVGVIDGRTYAFIGLERTGGVMVYDVTDPYQPRYMAYQREPSGDIAPEGVTFIAAADSPTGTPLLAVANEVSGTTTLYAVSVKSAGEMIGELMTAVSTLVAEGELSPGDGARLNQILELAQVAADNGQNARAVRHLNSFIFKVNHLVQYGRLSPENGATLTATAEAIIAVLE
jgi:hypothetical protein